MGPAQFVEKRQERALLGGATGRSRTLKSFFLHKSHYRLADSKIPQYL
jgi:hypothetical protein